MYGKALQYLLVWTGLGVMLFMVAKPSDQEVKKVSKTTTTPTIAFTLMQPFSMSQIKDFTARNQGFSDVIRAAADPKSKPIYLQKPGEQFSSKDKKD